MQPSGEIVLFERNGRPAIEVQLDGETVWLSQQQLADLFQTSKQLVSYHIGNIFRDGELSPLATVKDFLTVRFEGTRQVRRTVEYYNLDLVIALGYRVRSGIATQFRVWATERLNEYLTKGFTMDDERLKNMGGGNYWRELLARIRDIRSSEKVLYRQVLDLYSTSIDYDPRSADSAAFFAVVQNKLHYAAHGHTAAEVIAARADAGQPFMGLLSFSGNRPTKAEVAIAKNYLNEAELRRLNTLVSAYFDAAEVRAEDHLPTYMRDWVGHLDRMLTAMERPVLTDGGRVSHDEALTKAEQEYSEYKSSEDSKPTEVELAFLDHVKSVQREIEGKT